MFRQRKVRCPDGRVITVFRNPDHAFPIELRDWSARARATLGLLDGVDPGVDIELVSRIRGFLVKIDQANSSLQLHFRAAYNVYSHDPCSPENGRWYRDTTEMIIKADYELRTILIESENLNVENQRNVAEALERARAAFLESRAVHEIREAVQQGRGYTQRWT